MVDEKKEVSFQKLQKQIQDLIFLSKRRNALQEAKDFVRGEVTLSLRDGCNYFISILFERLF